ncbi:MAG: transporter, partial [Dongiaceae bacterium]
MRVAADGAGLGRVRRGRRVACLAARAALGATAVVVGVLAIAPGLSAQEDEAVLGRPAGKSADADELARAQRRIDEQERKLAEQARIVAEQQKLLLDQQRRLDELERRFAQTPPAPPAVVPVVLGIPGGAADQAGRRSQTYVQDLQPLPPIPLPPTTQQPVAPAPMEPLQPLQPPEPVAPEPETPTADEERPESEKPPELLLVEAGGVLLPPGTLQIEPSVEYTHISSNRVAISGFTIFEAIVIGTIRVDEIRRDIVTGALSARYGLLDRVQIEARAPGVWREDDEIFGLGTAAQEEITINGFGIGDPEVSAAWQPIIGDGWVPDVILRTRARFPFGESAFEIPTTTTEEGRRVLKRAPTGSGFYGVGPGTTFVWRVDPVVFFTGASYTFNLERSFNESVIDPGDTLEFFAGLNIAISEQVALNLSFVDQITQETSQDGEGIAGTDANDGRVTLGASVGLTDNISLLASAGIGLTEQSPDFTF